MSCFRGAVQGLSGDGGQAQSDRRVAGTPGLTLSTGVACSNAHRLGGHGDQAQACKGRQAGAQAKHSHSNAAWELEFVL